MKFVVLSLLSLLTLFSCEQNLPTNTEKKASDIPKDTLVEKPLVREPLLLSSETLVGGWVSESYMNYLKEDSTTLNKHPFDAPKKCPFHSLVFHKEKEKIFKVMSPWKSGCAGSNETVLDLSEDSLYTLGQKFMIAFAKESYEAYLSFVGDKLVMIIPQYTPSKYVYKKIFSSIPELNCTYPKCPLEYTLLKAEQELIAGNYDVYDSTGSKVASNVEWLSTGQILNWDKFEAFYLKMSEHFDYNLILLDSIAKLKQEESILMGAVEDEKILMIEATKDEIKLFYTSYRANTPS